ncbi:MAG TPA: translation initiation factor IF-2 [Kofleriaceae bacterium]|jgi:translation initiation factor IF-2|nr:translation initiation factor IF-2 [Kofleriaceae bacterium]
MRVYEIAKEVGIPNKDLIAKIRALGLEVNNHMSSLDADDVARIRRSLDKEKASVVAPAETKKLSTGTVLRRRSSGERADGDDVVGKPASTPPAPPVVAAPAPVIRRARAEAPTPTPPPPPHRDVPAREPIVARAPVAPTPAPTPAPKPAPAAEPHVHAEAPAAKPAPVEPPHREREVVRETPKLAVAPVEPAPVAAPTPPPIAPTPVARPVERPAPVAAAEAPVATASRSRVIVAGPQVVARNAHADSGNGTSAATSRQSHEPPPPPPSTPLPPRITPVRSHRDDGQRSGPIIEHRSPATARSQFELELERARARTADKPKTDIEVKPTNGDAAPLPPSPAPRDPSRPAVGTVIALPPRIKITERTPLGGRPAPGPLPVNPIRGRYAQQQQQRGRPGQGRPGGPHDMRKKLPLGKKGKQTTITTPAEHKRVVRIEDTIAVAELARSMGIKAPEVLKKLWGMGMTGVTINASIDFDTAQILASEFGYEVQNVAFNEEDAFAQPADDEGELVARAPVVTVMGHVDHGKTSLLDAIRKTRVAAGEAGGITQHVAAYKVKAPGHGDIVFLDTPGHEAFTEMRARGAQATDIVVLVVAANDGVMPQTVEALNHAKDAKVTIIVAVNKIDLPDAQPERVKQQLADHGLIPEEWGGDTIYVNVSALKGENIDKLLASIAVSAEVLELRASKDKPAAGIVIEARLDRSRGPMATVLVQEGTLHVGDIVVAGRTFGKVRAILDDRGENIDEAGPSTPIEVLGLDGVPDAGDQVNAAEDDKVAKQVVDFRRQSFRRRELASTGRVSLENLMARISEGIDQKELKIVLKADVQGSAEALKAALVKQSTEKVKVTVIAAGVGGITESDVNLAKAGNAIIVGFHVRPAGKSSKLAEQEDVEIRLYDIIYDALDEVKAAMAGLLAPIKREVAMGKLNVRDTFSIPKIGTVAGCMVTEGKVNRKAHLRIIRDAVQVYEGKIGSLRRFKDDVSEVQHGFECGVMVAGWNEVKTGDVIEAYEVIEEAAQL